MSATFTFDSAFESQNLNSNSIRPLHKQNVMLKYMELKNNDPKLTPEQLAQHLGYSK